MSKLWNIGRLCPIFAIFLSLCSVRGELVSKEDNTDKDGNPTHSGSINIDKNDWGSGSDGHNGAADSNVKKESIKNYLKYFHMLEDMNQETVGHDPGLKIFRGDNKDYEGSETNSESTDIDEDDLRLESRSGRKYKEDDPRIRKEQIKNGDIGTKQDFNKLEDMDEETVTHDPALKIFREDIKNKEGSPAQSGSETNSESTDIDKDDLRLESSSGRKSEEDDPRIKKEQIKKGGMGSKKDFNKLEDMNQETVTHDPAVKIFREENSDEEASKHCS